LPPIFLNEQAPARYLVPTGLNGGSSGSEVGSTAPDPASCRWAACSRPLASCSRSFSSRGAMPTSSGAMGAPMTPHPTEIAPLTNIIITNTTTGFDRCLSGRPTNPIERPTDDPTKEQAARASGDMPTTNPWDVDLIMRVLFPRL
jgi:hypothetical protein